MSSVPYSEPHGDGNMGEKEDATKELQGVQSGVSAKESEVSALRQRPVPSRAWQEVSRIAVGIKDRVSRLKAIGNGQVPAVVVRAWSELVNDI